MLYKNHQFQLSAPTRNDKFELLDELYSVWDINYHFEYITQKHETVTYHAPIKNYVKKTQNRTIFKITTGHCAAQKIKFKITSHKK